MFNINSLKSFNIIKAVFALVAIILLYGSFFVTPEGHVSIKKRFGEAIDSVAPGLHFKFPFVDSVEDMDVRTRKYTLVLNASTTGRNEKDEVELQMPSQVKISANWNIPVNAALEIYKKFGGLEQYEDRILDPRVTRATKQVFANYSIEQVVSERELVRGAIEVALRDALTGKLATMTDINIEDVDWTPKIKKAVEDKQAAKFAFEQEQYTLDKQNLQAQQTVNTANANASAITAESIANAAAIEREGEATAKAMTAKAKAIANNPQLVDLIKAERWNGVLPKVSGSTGMLMNMGNVLEDEKTNN